MMPLAQLSTTPVTSSQPPHTIRLARSASARGRRNVSHASAAIATSAAGSNQLICEPISEPNSRVSPVCTEENPPPPPPTLPLLLVPSSLPRPLYPNVSSRMLLPVEPPMYGRDPAGHSSTSATHQPAATTMAPSPASRCRIRRHGVVGAATRYAAARPGTISRPCSILVRKANPISAPAAISHRTFAFSVARTVAYAAAVISRTSRASGLSYRNISVATGVVARIAPASNPAVGVETLRTAAYRIATAATPSSACGTRIDHEFAPNSLTDRSITHSDAGGLSTVMKFDWSSEPNRNAFQLLLPDCAAAA